MSLTDKLKDAAWLIGFPMAAYLACSGMDSLSQSIPYIESLKNPFTLTKGIAEVIYILFLSELLTYNIKQNKN